MASQLDRSSTPQDDVLFHFEQRIARRADELSRQLGFDRWRALDHWRQAEREILAQVDEYGFPDWDANGVRPPQQP